MSERRPILRDAHAALWLGLGFYLVGSLFLYDAYEARGKARPFVMRFLPGA